ncbi:MAG: RecQ family ATP-dependent DNA helicase, partial [Anaerovoracaceae bacterium]
MSDKHRILKQYFGYTAFRDGQETIIDDILKGLNVVGIMPTGAGKSLCFQIPALMMEGITLVISPLISLMKDQVNALVQAGVKAAFLNSSLSPSQFQRVLRNAESGEYKIIYVAPERLLTEEFQNLVQKSKISMVTVDEAHCVSQWGQDFRPSYLLIEKFIEMLPIRPPVSAFTATATGEVREDIIRLLKLDNPTLVSTGFDRKNLYFEVKHPKDKMSTLLDLLKKYDQKSGIIYCSTRKNVEKVCDVLCEEGYGATRYHAGLSDQERKANQEDFLYDRSSIMAATNAFGMGIDKSNVSFVIHYNMPKDIESYYQEAGRAGRDGEPADCILLYSGQDVVTNQFLIENGNLNEALDE